MIVSGYAEKRGEKRNGQRVCLRTVEWCSPGSKPKGKRKEGKILKRQAGLLCKNTAFSLEEYAIFIAVFVLIFMSKYDIYLKCTK